MSQTEIKNFRPESEPTPDRDSRFSQYSYLPLTHPKLDQFYQQQKGIFWTPQEVGFEQDRNDMEDLAPEVQAFVKFICCFFAQADGIVIENLAENFQRRTSGIKEARNFYAIQNAVETIHNEAYSMMIDALIGDPREKQMAFNAIAHYPFIKSIATWMFKWMNPQDPLMPSVMAFASVEGILFSSAFAAVYWIKRMNKLPAFTKLNEWIARDEALHTAFGVALYHTITSLSPQEREEAGISARDAVPVEPEQARAIISGAVQVGEEFTRQALRIERIGMSPDEMVKYIKCTADAIATSFGLEPIYQATNPFKWMKIISLPNKSNFFETRVTEYAKPGAAASNVFDLEADF